MTTIATTLSTVAVTRRTCRTFGVAKAHSSTKLLPAFVPKSFQTPVGAVKEGSKPLKACTGDSQTSGMLRIQTAGIAAALAFTLAQGLAPVEKFERDLGEGRKLRVKDAESPKDTEVGRLPAPLPFAKARRAEVELEADPGYLPGISQEKPKSSVAAPLSYSSPRPQS